jgi:hypothetical protein
MRWLAPPRACTVTSGLQDQQPEDGWFSQSMWLETATDPRNARWLLLRQRQGHNRHSLNHQGTRAPLGATTLTKTKKCVFISFFDIFSQKSFCSSLGAGTSSARMNRNKLKIRSGGVQIERACVDTFSAVWFTTI